MLNYFITKKDQQKLTILKMILFAPEGQLVQDIMEQLSIKRRTSLRYLVELEEEIAEVFPEKNVYLHQSDQIDKFIIYKDKEISDHRIIDSLRLNYIQKGNLYIVFNAVLINNYSSVKQLALDINMSSAAIYKYLAIIKAFFGKFDSTLSLTNKHGNFEGNELGTRYALYAIFWFIFRTNQFRKRVSHVPLELFDLSSISKSIRPELELSLSQKSKLTHLQVTMLFRVIYRGKYLNMPDSFWDDIQFFYKPELHFNSELEKKIPTDIIKREKTYFSYATRSVINNLDSYDQKKALVSAYKNSGLEIADHLAIFLKQFQRKFHFPQTSKEEVETYYSLILHFIYFKHIGFNTIELFNGDLSMDRLVDADPSLQQLEDEIIEFVREQGNVLNLGLKSKSSEALAQLTHFLFWSVTTNKKIKPTTIYIQCSKNSYMTASIEKVILKFTNAEAVHFIDKISEADIIIADMYEGDYPQASTFYFEGTFDPKIWSAMISFITQALWKNYS